MINCEFSEPKTFNNSPAETKQDIWAYSKMTCQGDLEASSSSIPIFISQVNSPDNSRSFYLNKSLSYGDILILFFIVFFLVFGIIGVIRKLLTEKFLTRRLF